MDYFLIDGYNMCFRAYYAMPELTRSDGFPTGALHAFFAGIIKLSSMDVPHSSAIFFDEGGSARHREIYPEYKANRDAMLEPMRMQIEPIRELCRLLGFFVKSQNGVEADDLLASAAELLFAKGSKISIVSADKDFAQLVRPGIRRLNRLSAGGKSTLSACASNSAFRLLKFPIFWHWLAIMPTISRALTVLVRKLPQSG